jgi:hypothetical protein
LARSRTRPGARRARGRRRSRSSLISRPACRRGTGGTRSRRPGQPGPEAV